ncbi:Charged multivesicular body protein 2a-like [Gracilariopsis chorda]|uniref:Charged multivesicular body protein 2a-like n=1 Tax=Gracilariopsis chorda TaxID=448386 RepID=A0A2V3INC9_9FLOR|nr:Charged multivesicular body protein 2a-like [Gracilariopsis chorda]|eukprot:PXF43582.1 Charged multivesicular body protein 2a-like [Gracilariopsis chorda]
MTWLFGKKEPIAPPPPPAPAPETLGQQIKRNQRSIDKACRELERERLKMTAQEQKVKVQIKKIAKEGQIEAARMLARDLVRTRSHITRMYKMRTQMQSVSMQLTSMRTNESMASAMGNVVQIMARINQNMNLPAMQNVMMQFEMEHGKMEMTQEMVDDAMGDVLSGADEEAQTDDVINQVLDELGLEQGSKLGAVAAAHGTPAQMNPAVNDSAIEARMENLRR